MSRQPKLRPKSNIPGFPDAMYDLAAAQSLSQLESRAGLGEEKQDQRVFRVKRKHVLKACDRCRVKKTKCDGKQPCNRCSAYNHPCLFRERKATQTKVYSRGFVEMLESHHSLVVKALQRLYKLCLDKEGFPGDPLPEAPDGYPLTHAILDRLGLIKQAEDNPDEPDEDTEDLQYLRMLSTSTDCSATTDPSPEPATPPDPSPCTSTGSPISHSPPRVAGPVPVQVPTPGHGHGPWKWDAHPTSPVVPAQAQAPAPAPAPYQTFSGPSTSGLAYHGMPVPRPSMVGSLDAEAKAADMMPSSTINEHDHHYLYYGDSSHCAAEPASSKAFVPGVAAQQQGFHMAAPTEMMDYNLHLPEHAVYSGGWSYPCG